MAVWQVGKHATGRKVKFPHCFRMPPPPPPFKELHIRTRSGGEGLALGMANTTDRRWPALQMPSGDARSDDGTVAAVVWSGWRRENYPNTGTAEEAPESGIRERGRQVVISQKGTKRRDKTGREQLLNQSLSISATSSQSVGRGGPGCELERGQDVQGCPLT